MELVQTFEQAINGYWDGGAKKRFVWSIDREYSNGRSRVGSWEANHFFEVTTGKTEKQTLANARRKLTAMARKHNMSCTFEYVKE